MTIDQLQAKRETILATMGGPRSVAYQDRSMTQPEQKELQAALQQIDAEIARVQSPASRLFTIQTSRGL